MRVKKSNNGVHAWLRAPFLHCGGVIGQSSPPMPTQRRYMMELELLGSNMPNTRVASSQPVSGAGT